jgi:hypothetical protein
MRIGLTGVELGFLDASQAKSARPRGESSCAPTLFAAVGPRVVKSTAKLVEIEPNCVGFIYLNVEASLAAQQVSLWQNKRANIGRRKVSNEQRQVRADARGERRGQALLCRRHCTSQGHRMISYPTEDYKKYIYGLGKQRVRRLHDSVGTLDADIENSTDLTCSLDQLEMWLYLAAFVDDDEACSDMGWHVRDLMRGDAVNTYSDGRAVATTIRWDGGWVTHVWHPDPLHPSNQPGQVFDLEEESGCRRRLIITAPGILDTFETGEEVGVCQSDLQFGE